MWLYSVLDKNQNSPNSYLWSEKQNPSTEYRILCSWEILMACPSFWATQIYRMLAAQLQVSEEM